MRTAPNSKDVTIGMTDAELEAACKVKIIVSRVWVYWASEKYSIGKCLRYWSKYPRVLPLNVFLDHAVGLWSQLFPHELDNQANVHFTWHPLKEQRSKENLSKKKVIRITHPWITYRRLRGITRSSTPRGTLVFYMHNTNSLKWVGRDTEEYFEKLRELPDKFQPVVLCLHMHDINTGVHKELRRQGFPIVTAGNTSTTNFVDCFYDHIKSYSYATSQAFGSAVAYCVELGVPYFFLGETPRVINNGDKNLPHGSVPEYYDEFHEEYGEKAKELFGVPMDTVTDEQRAFIQSLLGLDSEVTRWRVSWILWRELFCNWHAWRVVVGNVFVRPLRRLLKLVGVT